MTIYTLKEIEVQCSHCPEVMKRTHKVKNPICYDCKVKKQKDYSNVWRKKYEAK